MITRCKTPVAFDRSRRGSGAGTKPLRCIHIGCAPNTRGSNLIDLLQERRETFQSVALVDATTELAAAERERLGWATIYCCGSLAHAFREVEADAAIITTPTALHAEHIQACLEAGLHVFTAKPMTYDLDEAVRLVRLAESRGRFLLVDQQQQHLHTERTAADWVRNKKYGAVGFASFTVHRYRPQMLRLTGPYPFIWEQGCHSFNTLLAILQRPAISVSSHQFQPPWSVYKGATVVMGEIEFEGALPCQFTGSFESRGFSMEIRIECEQASVRIVSEVDSWHKRIEVALPGEKFEPTGIEDKPVPGRPEFHNFDAFYRGCTEGGRVTNDGRDNLRTLAIVDAFIRSSQSGRRETVRIV